MVRFYKFETRLKPDEAMLKRYQEEGMEMGGMNM